ncbi:MAG: hypothetical protein ACC662_10055, partial [Planctomycetota bacterium]
MLILRILSGQQHGGRAASALAHQRRQKRRQNLLSVVLAGNPFLEVAQPNQARIFQIFNAAKRNVGRLALRAGRVVDQVMGDQTG